MSYNFSQIEKKWQQKWVVEKTFKTKEVKGKKCFYVLDMFPYPSGFGLHVGHCLGYTASDIIARFKIMQGYNVLHPIGWDAFGLPAEQYAVKTNNHPASFTNKNIIFFRQQLQSMGYAYDWDKEINTSNPKYMKWTQWIFKRLYDNNLAKLETVPVNWCDALQTVLANDEIIINSQGKKVSERGEHLVIQKPMRQWVLKISEYAHELVKGLKNLNWPSSTKKMQQNWIQDKVSKKIMLHDWIFSRQRYWGEPFPLQHQDGKITLVDDLDLPLCLPYLKDFKGKNGQPALANCSQWVKKGYDLNTMPSSAGSSWYFLAYILKEKDHYLALNSSQAQAKINQWMPIDLYIGGAEHTVGHLLYARFWNIFLAKQGFFHHQEPFKKLIHQGMILGFDGKKMSKSRGNVVTPEAIIKQYGSDALRCYLMFMGPFEDSKKWSNQGIKAASSWLQRVWRIITKTTIKKVVSQQLNDHYQHLVNQVTKDYNSYKFNVAISKMMVFINDVSQKKVISLEIIKGFLQLLNPICPHLSEELWELKGFDHEIAHSCWPTFKKKASKFTNIVIQQNGKFKKVFQMPLNSSQEAVITMIKNKTKLILKDKKIIFVANKVLNIVD